MDIDISVTDSLLDKEALEELSLDESDTLSIDDLSPTPLQYISCRGRKQRLQWSWIAQFVLFSASIFTFFLASIFGHSQPSNCVQKHSMYSPALEAVHDNYQLWRFNGTFREKSPYKGPPSPEVDAAWDRLINIGAFNLSPDAITKIGASPDSVRLPPESGGGYMAMLEMHHQIHCVNLLWQHTYPDYYGDKKLAAGDRPSTFRLHLDHCADLLRQKLMCDADIGVITYNWVRNHHAPTPNFNTQHKCRNFEDILDWALQHQAPVPHSGAVERVGGEVELEDLP